MIALMKASVVRSSSNLSWKAVLAISVMVTTLTMAGGMPASAGCGDKALPSRVIHMDLSTTGHNKGVLDSASFLREKEVVLTFDDGPLPVTSRRILAALDDYCAKATFFLVGRMARAFPTIVADMAGRGHTIGFHTFTHANLKGRAIGSSQSEITRNVNVLNSILSKTGQARAMAPFFRFPYLKRSSAVQTYLSKKGFLTVGVDIDSSDWKHTNGASIVNSVLGQLKYRKRGIILFHDIKRATARVLPRLLGELKRRGYRVVHLRSTSTGVASVASLAGQGAPILANADSQVRKSRPARVVAVQQRRDRIPLSARQTRSNVQHTVRSRIAGRSTLTSGQKPASKARQNASTKQVLNGTEYNFSNASPPRQTAAKPVRKLAVVQKQAPRSTTSFNFNQSGKAAANNTRVRKPKAVAVVTKPDRRTTAVNGQNINGKSFNFVSVAPAGN